MLHRHEQHASRNPTLRLYGLYHSDAELLMDPVSSNIASDKQLVVTLPDIEKLSSVLRESIRNQGLSNNKFATVRTLDCLVLAQLIEVAGRPDLNAVVILAIPADDDPLAGRGVMADDVVGLCGLFLAGAAQRKQQE